ncbi:putative polysaccharide biosynthesis protein [Alteribacillus iranensis]|uniref:Polysaccharide transporter, PST family n=1 Tax=Alteribacillus iranensis TaxID=930128 RepID=A0A1I2FE90_9BACI|nr:polysaccharide biosynthesis protein [Alteribacillus iranensis]SFF03565.1 polysaccharide transporter, PST family [Alteribacillus iranensis]
MAKTDEPVAANQGAYAFLYDILVQVKGRWIMEEVKGRRSGWWKGAVFLTLAAFIGKILSAFYRVPYQNITGDLGYYVYQQIYPFYGAAMVVSMYGFPVLISKLVLEKEQKQHSLAAQEIAWSAFFILLIAHLPIALVFMGGAGIIAGWMGDSQLLLPLRIIGCVFFFIPFYSALRGYFQGTGNMSPTAVSHVIEQFVRVTAILLLVWLVVRSNLGAYSAGTAAAVGSIAGCVAGVSVLLFATKKKRASFRQLNWSNIINGIKTESGTLLSQGLFICLGSMIFILYQLVDAFYVANELENSGMTAIEARKIKGLFDRGQPLIQFGTVAATSIALTMVPLISQVRDKRLACQYANLAFRVSVLLGSAAAIGLVIIAEPVNIFLFENDEGTGILRILAFTLIFSGPVFITTAVMQGHNHFKVPAIYLGVGWLVKLLGNIVLLPLFGVKGAAAATVMGMFVTAVFHLLFIYRKGWMTPLSLKWLAKAGAALFLMAALAGSSISLAGFVNMTRTTSAILSIGIVIGSALIFTLAVWHLSLFSDEERRLLPGARKLEGLRKRKER